MGLHAASIPCVVHTKRTGFKLNYFLCIQFTQEKNKSIFAVLLENMGVDKKSYQCCCFMYLRDRQVFIPFFVNCHKEWQFEVEFNEKFSVDILRCHVQIS